MQYDETLFNDVRELLVECLSVEEDEITPEASFFGDLGGESLDILDFSFRCEKKLGVRANFEKMFSTEEFDFDEDGNFATESLLQLKKRFPFLKFEILPDHPKPIDLRELLTVSAMCCFLQLAMNQESRF